MEHKLGRINIITWQDQRVHGVHRPNTLTVILGALAAISAVLLALRFLAGAPVPLELLQAAFAVFVASGSLLLMRGLVGLILAMQQR